MFQKYSENYLVPLATDTESYHIVVTGIDVTPQKHEYA